MSDRHDSSVKDELVVINRLSLLSVFLCLMCLNVESCSIMYMLSDELCNAPMWWELIVALS